MSVLHVHFDFTPEAARALDGLDLALPQPHPMTLLCHMAVGDEVVIHGRVLRIVGRQWAMAPVLTLVLRLDGPVPG